MYCKNCGKKIEYDANVCYECQRDEILFGQSVNAVETHKNTEPCSIKEEKIDTGIGKAIAGVILGGMGLFSSWFAFMFAMVASMSSGFFGDIYAVERVLAIVFAIIGIVPSIIGIVFGLKSIRRFIKIKNESDERPVATLVLGIVGTATGGFGTFFSFLSLIVSMITMAI